MQFGVDAVMTESLTSEMRKHTNKLLILKLSPNVTKIEDIAMAAEAGGADMISAINTVVGMGINIHNRKPVLNTVFGGLSGPAIKPIALANVHKIYKAVSVPIIGIGGISTAEDVIEFIMAGADLVQVGTSNFKDPSIGLKITKGLEPLCKTLEVTNIHDLKGTLEYY
jgi:dihydroorotate dehydrogenase (NAD+) catalytic subunit